MTEKNLLMQLEHRHQRLLRMIETRGRHTATLANVSKKLLQEGDDRHDEVWAQADVLQEIIAGLGRLDDIYGAVHEYTNWIRANLATDPE